MQGWRERNIMAKIRSPHYPSQTLEEAIQRVEQVYNLEHTHSSPRNVVAEGLGYTSLNGASLSVIATLTRYGLLEAVGDGLLKVSDDAVSVLVLDDGEPEKTAALQRLAFTPKLFTEIREKYGEQLPSDVNLKHFLIQQKKFLPKASDEVIRVYRENLKFVTAQNESCNVSDDKPQKQPEGQTPMTQISAAISAQNQTNIATPPAPQMPVGVHEFSFPLSIQRNVKAVVTIYGDKVQRRDLDFLQKQITVLIEGFEDEPEAQPSPQITSTNENSTQSDKTSQ
jgi:hypothetical protein